MLNICENLTKDLILEKIKDLSYELIELEIENTIDDTFPRPFIYIEKTINDEKIVNYLNQIFTSKKTGKNQQKKKCYCTCENECLLENNCNCAIFNKIYYGNSSNPPYLIKNEEKLLNLTYKSKNLFECNLDCHCNKNNCQYSFFNNNNEKLLKNKYNLNSFIITKYTKKNAFKSEIKLMWGLKTKEFIPKNTYIFYYLGELITFKEANTRGIIYDNIELSYLFDLNSSVSLHNFYCNIPKNQKLINIDGVITQIDIPNRDLELFFEYFPLCIDAFFCGNLSRFINHSCDPNINTVQIHFGNRETRNPLIGSIVFYSNRDIQCKEELTIDYHYYNSKQKNNLCFCGTKKCSGYFK